MSQNGENYACASMRVCCYGNFYVCLLQGSMLHFLFAQKYLWWSPKAVGNVSMQNSRPTVSVFWMEKKKSSVHRPWPIEVSTRVLPLKHAGQLLPCNPAFKSDFQHGVPLWPKTTFHLWLKGSMNETHSLLIKYYFIWYVLNKDLVSFLNTFFL